MKRSNFFIIKGGNSSEKDVSLRTAACVEAAFSRMGINYRSQTIRSSFDLAALPLKEVDYVFNAMHGGDGENGIVQSILDLSGVPYNGANRETSTVCISKFLTRCVASANAITVPKGVIGATDNFFNLQRLLGNRFIVKPDSQGCSIGVNLVSDEDQFKRAVLEACRFNDRLLFEEFIYGREITVAILDGQILPFLSIRHSQDIFNFDAKFKSKDTLYDVANSLSAHVSDLIRANVNTMRATLKLEHYARFDFIIRDDTPYLLEINTLPGLNTQSVFVKACLLAGIHYDEMIRKIIGSSHIRV